MGHLGYSTKISSNARDQVEAVIESIRKEVGKKGVYVYDRKI